jgi:hypothetical protein
MTPIPWLSPYETQPRRAQRCMVWRRRARYWVFAYYEPIPHKGTPGQFFEIVKGEMQLLSEVDYWLPEPPDPS